MLKALALVAPIAFAVGCTHTEARDARMKDVALWYEAFNKKDPSLIDRILSEKWVDIPAAPGQPAGPEGAKRVLAELTTAFPDFRASIKDILQDGDRVIVRSELTGTQRGAFMGIAGNGRQLSIQAIDIHEFREGRIVRTWHTEDWLSGLHQLGLFEK